MVQPFLIKSISPHGAVELAKDDETNTFKVNAQRLKPYLGGDLPTKRVGLVLTDL